MNRRILLLLTGVLLFSGLALLFLKDQSLARLLTETVALLHNGDRLREAILAQGALAPLLFVGLQILQVILFPLPGEASGFLGGYLFGAWGGLFYSTLGLTIGSWLAYGIGSIFRQAIQNRLAHTIVHRRFNHLVAKGGFVIPFLLFLLPGFPKDSLSYLLGLSRMPWRVFLCVAAVGRIPGTLMLSFQGAQVYERDYLTLLLLLAASLLLGLPFYLYRQRLLTWLEGYGRQRQPAEITTTPPGRHDENI
jgi:uncharacterized membrane protein YdjX (TVP38/TMEM64 family)